jgi:antitoxin component YwqK of YwqJK toxin-antitoxin module
MFISSVKSSLTFCLILLSFSSVFGQKVLKENLTKKTTHYWDFQKKHKESVGAYYKDPLGETTFKHGKWEFFDRHGNLIEERNYFRGKLHGAVILKYPNGKMKQEGYFKLDEQDSVYREWNETGKINIEGFFIKNVAAGNWTHYYIDGRKQMIEEIVGETHYVRQFWLPDSLHTQTITDGTGEKAIFYSTGQIKEWYNYKNGLYDGPFEERSIYGHPLVEGAYKSGKKTGEWKFYYYTGDLEKTSFYEDDKLNGKYQYFYDNGKINVEGNYKNGKKSGLWTWYTNKGTRDMSGTFKEDLQDGDWTYWYPTGELSYYAKYKEGQRAGTWSYFYKNGAKYKKGSFSNDEKDGLWETWYENGKLLMSGKYVKGKEEGEWKNYWENGKLKNQTSFKKGLLDGEWKSFSPTGVIQLSGFYEEGLKTKEWINYFENGKPKDLITYKIIKRKSAFDYGPMKDFESKISIKHGPTESYSAKDFKLTEKGEYKDDEKHGEWTAFYPGGKMSAVTSQYKKGKLNGAMRQYDRRGIIMSEIEYKDGLKHGKFRTFDKKGNVLAEKEFENGMQVIKERTFTGGGFAPK